MQNNIRDPTVQSAAKAIGFCSPFSGTETLFTPAKGVTWSSCSRNPWTIRFLLYILTPTFSGRRYGMAGWPETDRRNAAEEAQHLEFAGGL
jgi:hypothetical protein